MNISKKLLVYIVIYVSVLSSFMGCSKIDNSLNQSSTLKPTSAPSTQLSCTDYENPIVNYTNDGTKNDSSSLESWIGSYTFSEYAPPDQNMFYTISIYKEDNKYFSKLNIDGFQTIVRLQAKVSGDEKSIKLLFEKYLPDNQFEPYDKGDILLSFEKRESSIYTSWEKIKPMLESNYESSKVYFKIGQ